MQVCAGAVYAFGAVADDLKQNLHTDTHEQALIAIAGNLGQWGGSLSGGLLADARGPRVAMLGGAALFFVGYGGMYLALSHSVDALRPPAVVAFFYLLAGLGSGWVMNSSVRGGLRCTRSPSTARTGNPSECLSPCGTVKVAACALWRERVADDRAIACGADVHQHAELVGGLPPQGRLDPGDSLRRRFRDLVHALHRLHGRPRAEAAPRGCRRCCSAGRGGGAAGAVAAEPSERGCGVERRARHQPAIAPTHI
jgi:hypothetical protein